MMSNSETHNPRTNGNGQAPIKRRYDAEVYAFPHRVSEILSKYMLSLEDRSHPVVRFASPDEISKAFIGVGITSHLDDDQAPVSLDTLLAACRVTLDYSVRTGHPRFYNQLYAAVHPVSVAGEYLSAVCNTNTHTFEVAPVFTILEHEVLSKMARAIDPSWGDHHDGLFVPGGSIANMYGLQMARFKKDPDFRKRGASGGPRLVAFTSAQAHYSYLKACILLGIGSDNLVRVKCDNYGRMIPEVLEKEIQAAIANGGVPFFVGATAGTTVLGAFDDFEKIADICASYNLWMHVDGCWGAATVLSPKHSHMMKGAPRADSLAWNLHKMMGLPMQCSVILSRHEGLLTKCNATNASYLFQKDKNFAELDLGDKTIQCGRHVDVMKIWLAWKAIGDKGYEELVDHAFDLAEYTRKKIAEDSTGGFVMTYPGKYCNICFWYVPSALRPFKFEEASTEQRALLGRVAPFIKDRMQRTGTAMIGFQELDERPNFFRLVLVNPSVVTFEDIDKLFELIRTFGDEFSS